jgi:hypothetical protein
MLSFSRWLLGATIVSALQAAPPLTTIQDVLYKADGSRFSGLVTISWDSFEAGDSSNVAAQTLRVPVTNGYLRVQLVPTTAATTPTTYSVSYNSSGKTQFSEIWSVPPSSVSLRLRDVRLGTGTAQIQISDVAGLTNELNIRPVKGAGYANSHAAAINSSGGIDGVLGTSSDCVHVDGTAGPCGTGSGATAGFVDNETPSGVMDGVNYVFALSSTPNPPSSLSLFRNGMLMLPGLDYTLAANVISFPLIDRPQSGDIIMTSYRTTGNVPGVGFVDGQIPTGTADGVNTVFTLPQIPNPISSLALYRNGIRMKLNLDYTVAGSTITFGPAYAPQAGDILQCSYRTVQ